MKLQFNGMKFEIKRFKDGSYHVNGPVRDAVSADRSGAIDEIGYQAHGAQWYTGTAGKRSLERATVRNALAAAELGGAK